MSLFPRRSWFFVVGLLGVLSVFALTAVAADETDTSGGFENSIGMKFVRIEPGQFEMGSSDGDFDELPVHTVVITKAFNMAATEVTNAQYELFDPGHSRFRGQHGLSKGDDEAVIYVDWNDAAGFCEWLSKKEGKPYRLPTEAEWEYACRAGTATAYSTGEELPKVYHRSQKHVWQEPVHVSLRVGATPPNHWGLYDMHGNVEEWCSDWFGPYEAAEQSGPVGRITGTFKITRGGSHNTTLPYLRSANRMGTLPEDKHWLIGFRVVMGDLPDTPPLPVPPAKCWAADVSSQKFDWSHGSDMKKPYFEGPITYVLRPEHPETVPMYKHNHCPSITWCDNGDLLAVWFSTKSEGGREMTILASRLRAGTTEWELPSEFFKAPDRNMTGSSLFNDGKGTLYHFNGLEADGTWGKLAMTLRTSRDNGASWTHPRLISPEHRHRNQVIDGTSMTKEGYLLQPCDAVHGGDGGTALHISRDGGQTWNEYGHGKPKPEFKEGETGAWIAGIHGGAVQLKDASILAFGRGDAINGHMPMSLSKDMAKTWTYSASEFSTIGGGQRLVIMRLREGPLLFVSFTDNTDLETPLKGMEIKDRAGKKSTVYGLFAAVSYDEGKTWPVRRLMTDDGEARVLAGLGNTGDFTMDRTHAEPRGYMAATQSPDGVIHLISSGLHYRFNLAWIEALMPAE